MARHYGVVSRQRLVASVAILLSFSFTLGATDDASGGRAAQSRRQMRKVPYPADALDLRAVPYKILFETYTD